MRNEINKVRKKLLKKAMTQDSKNFWKGVKSLMGQTDGGLNKIVIDNETISDKKLIADHFVGMFTKKVDDLLGVYNPSEVEKLDDSDFVPFTIEEINKGLKRLSNKKCWGMDSLPCSFIKEMGEICVPYLLRLFNKIALSNEIPSTWKIARIMPVFKKGASDDPKNYRPVSNLNSIAKLFEICLLQRLELLDFDKINGLNQHGFRKQHSCETAICELVGIISDELDEGRKVCVYSADLTAAFDLLRKEILFKKMCNLGIPNYLINLICEYLTDRYGYVEVENEISCVAKIKTGCI